METARKILIIDDDDDFRAMLKKMLVRADYQVLEANNGVQGVEVYKRHQVDLVITDLFMPDKDGTETAKELKQINQDVKIIAISGGGAKIANIDFEDIKLEYGFLRILQKPFRLQELKSVMSEVLE